MYKKLTEKSDKVSNSIFFFFLKINKASSFVGIQQHEVCASSGHKWTLGKKNPSSRLIVKSINTGPYDS